MTEHRAPYALQSPLPAAPLVPVPPPPVVAERVSWARGDGWRVALREDGSVAVQRRCRDWPDAAPPSLQVELLLTAAEWRCLGQLFAAASVPWTDQRPWVPAAQGKEGNVR